MVCHGDDVGLEYNATHDVVSLRHGGAAVRLTDHNDKEIGLRIKDRPGTASTRRRKSGVKAGSPRRWSLAVIFVSLPRAGTLDSSKQTKEGDARRVGYSPQRTRRSAATLHRPRHLVQRLRINVAIVHGGTDDQWQCAACGRRRCRYAQGRPRCGCSRPGWSSGGSPGMKTTQQGCVGLHDWAVQLAPCVRFAVGGTCAGREWLGSLIQSEDGGYPLSWEKSLGTFTWLAT
jgi:hypothetical protein